MYGFIWRHLPGDTTTRAFVAVGAALAVVAILWYLVFPWAEPKIAFDHGTVGDGSSAPAAPAHHR